MTPSTAPKLPLYQRKGSKKSRERESIKAAKLKASKAVTVLDDAEVVAERKYQLKLRKKAFYAGMSGKGATTVTKRAGRKQKKKSARKKRLLSGN